MEPSPRLHVRGMEPGLTLLTGTTRIQEEDL